MMRRLPVQSFLESPILNGCAGSPKTCHFPAFYPLSISPSIPPMPCFIRISAHSFYLKHVNNDSSSFQLRFILINIGFRLPFSRSVRIAGRSCAMDHPSVASKVAMVFDHLNAHLASRTSQFTIIVIHPCHLSSCSPPSFISVHDPWISHIWVLPPSTHHRLSSSCRRPPLRMTHAVVSSLKHAHSSSKHDLR
ncbi:hypothetical protein BDN70DRAFT_674859 [Pholiota conissans]|uniref:Uncharacterized protein n=1 Tax=Pholiota conissans TaxID=109636 RepID=A0A9P5Z1Y1_9AGAR|nr:hypothetical protein BDN70DRAFT_674859 [Pholiota conissans]